MANIREIQTRINSVKDTMKITNAMYLISSTKMRQARKKLADAEPYFYRRSQGKVPRRSDIFAPGSIFINCRLRLPESCVICRK
jgi:C1A family cysteine protease